MPAHETLDGGAANVLTRHSPGKTYTMTGDEADRVADTGFASKGIIPRALHHIFASLEEDHSVVVNSI